MSSNMVVDFSNKVIDTPFFDVWSVWFGVVLIGICVFMYFVFWTYRDAQQRTDRPFLVALMVFLAGPVGLLMWLVFRPRNPDTTSR